MNTNIPRFYSEKQLIDIFNCSRSVIQKWKRQGMPAHSLCGIVRYEFPVIMKWLQARGKEAYKRDKKLNENNSSLGNGALNGKNKNDKAGVL